MSFASISHVFLFVILGLFLSNTNYCQEDYELGAQSTRSEQTPTATPTEEGDDDDGLATSTPTPDSDATATPVPTSTEVPDDETEDDTPTPTPTEEVDTESLLRSLQKVSATPVARVPDTPTLLEGERPSHVSQLAAGGGSGSASNWLGQLYLDDNGGQDSDDDGFRDDLEDSFGTDPFDPSDFPSRLRTSLRARLGETDPDLDGLNVEEERRWGTQSDLQDTDGDGFSDGVEVLSGTDPNDRSSIPQDYDGDGLSDAAEKDFGTDPRKPDSDGDSLDDDFEVAIRSNPLAKDSDFDGVSDGVEVAMGSDPLVPETVPR